MHSVQEHGFLKPLQPRNHGRRNNQVCNEFNNIPACEYSETTLKADVVDVTALKQIEEMGGINSLLCQAQILAGGLSEPRTVC